MSARPIAMLTAVTVMAALNAHAQTVTFESPQAGQSPSGFQFGRTGQGAHGVWAVVDEKDAQNGKALEQSSPDPTSYRFPLAMYGAVDAANVDVQVRFKPISGKVDQAGGIAVRVSSPDNYYVLRANALEDNVRFYRVVRGNREQLGTADLKVAPNTWHSLGLKAEGNRFTITFNGRELYTITDATIPGPGKVALWTKADSVTRFDRLVITRLP